MFSPDNVNGFQGGKSGPFGSSRWMKFVQYDIVVRSSRRSASGAFFFQWPTTPNTYGSSAP